MSATAVVAIVGAIATPLVAIAGYIFNERRSRSDRAAAQELAEGERQHEERLRRHERLYTARRDTYLDLLRQLFVEVQIVDRTENPASSREPPPMPPEEEWSELRARVWAFGSPQVNEAVDAFDAKVRAFHDGVAGYEQVPTAEPETQTGPDGDLGTRRSEVRGEYERVRTLTRDELAGL